MDIDARGRRWRPWLAVAPAAVIAVAVTLVAVRNAPATPGDGVPRYYVGIFASPYLANQAAPEAIVGDTFTGKKLASVPAPAGWRFLPAMAAAGDDRTFVVGATPRSGDLLRTERLYVIRLTPGAAHFAALRALPIPAPQVSWDYGSSMALSRDGSMLAVMAGATEAGSNPPVNIRLLQVSDPGHDLIADSRVVLTVSSPGCGLVSGDGKTVVCGSSAPVRESGTSSNDKACPGAALRQTAAIHRYSAATGKLTGSLYQVVRSCDAASLTPSWTSDDGNAVLGYFMPGTFGTRFGLFTPGEFTPLPAPLAYPAFATW